MRRHDTDPHAPIPVGTRIAPHGEKTGDELLADVLADPASNDLRMVYADYLLERGDPRGELIALQLAGRDSVREHVLLAAYVATWTQPLYDGLAPDSIRYARGFLAACRTLPNLALRDSIGHPLWATVEELDTTELALVVNPCLRALRALRAPIESVGRLTAVSHPVPVEHLDLTRTFFDDHGRLLTWHWQDLFAVGALVRVRSLALAIGIEEVEPFAPLLASPLGAQLDRLELEVQGAYPLARWCQVARNCALTIRCGGVTLEHERVVLELGHGFGEATLRTLQSFAGSPIRQLVIAYPHDAEPVMLDAIVRRLAPVFAEIVPQARWSDAPS